MTHPDALRLVFALGPGAPPRCPAADLYATLERIWPQHERWAAWRAHRRLDNLVEAASRQLATLEASGAKAVFSQDAAFPSALHRAPYPPPVIFCQGDVELLRDAAGSVAVVGSRAVFRREQELATALGREATTLGRTVVSGGAIGVDTAAHRGALEAEGKTVAVLGSGLDRLYPPRNRELFAEVVARGGLLLTPFAPGTPPRRANFPARNALVAAASSLVIVVAAAARSGALSTARHAMRLGVALAALPGTAGCDGLLAKGQARALRSSDDLAALLAGDESPVAAPLDSGGLELLTMLAEHGRKPAELSTLLRRPLAEITATLLDLELDGRVIRGPGGIYRVV